MGFSVLNVPPSSTFYAAGVTQLRSAQLTSADYNNAYQSLLTVDPTSTPTQQAAFAGQWTTDLAYFIVDATGAPQLVIPSNSPSFGATPTPTPVISPALTTATGFVAPAAPTPTAAPTSLLVAAPLAASTAPAGAVIVPAGAPCPSGFLASPTDVASAVGQALTLLPAGAMTQTTATISGACRPTPV